MMKRFFGDLIHSTIQNNIGFLAAVIAFFGFSSLLPVLTMLIFITSFIVPTDAVSRFLQGILQSYVPDIPTGATFALRTIQRLKTFKSDISIVGFAGLLWGVVGGFVTLQQTLDIVFKVRKRRSFLSQYVVGFTMMGVLLALTVGSSLISAVSPRIVAKIVHANNAEVLHLVHDLSRITFPVVLLITCYCCYRVLPSRTLRNIPLFLGALVATVLIYISRALFVIYTNHLVTFEVLYGTLAFVMLLTFWIYIVCILLLFGAQIAVTITEFQKIK